MKKIFSIAAIVTAFVFIASCKKEEDEGKVPNLSFKTGGTYVSADVTLKKDTTVTVGISASKAEDKDVLISFAGGVAYDAATSDSSIYAETLSGTNGDIYSKDITIHTRSKAGTEKYTFTVINKDGLKNSVSFKVMVN
jgi:alcohol dehydrogenase class IV